MALSTVTHLLIAGGLAALAAGAVYHHLDAPERTAREARDRRSRGELYPALHLYEKAQAQARDRDQAGKVASYEEILTELREQLRQRHAEAGREKLRLLQEAGQAGNWRGVILNHQAAELEIASAGDVELEDRLRNVGDSPHLAVARVGEAYQSWETRSGGHGVDPWLGLYAAFQVQGRLGRFPELRQAHRELLAARDALSAAQRSSPLDEVRLAPLRRAVGEKEASFQRAIADRLKDLHQVDPSSREWPESPDRAPARTAARVPDRAPAAVSEIPGDEDLHRADS